MFSGVHLANRVPRSPFPCMSLFWLHLKLTEATAGLRGASH